MVIVPCMFSTCIGDMIFPSKSMPQKVWVGPSVTLCCGTGNKYHCLNHYIAGPWTRTDTMLFEHKKCTADSRRKEKKNVFFSSLINVYIQYFYS